MKFNVAERVALLPILPAEGDFTTLKILRELQGKVGFSEEDFKRFQIKRTENRVEWNGVEGAKEVEIELGEKGTEIVRDTLLALDKNKKLKPEHLSLYEKFVQDKAEEKK